MELGYTSCVTILMSSGSCGMMMLRTFGTSTSGRTSTYALSHIMLQAEKLSVMMMRQDGSHQHYHADKH